MVAVTAGLLMACSGIEPPEEVIAGAEEEPGAYSQKLLGISTTNPPKQIVFLGKRKAIEQQLKDSLAGKKTDEVWYRVELPASRMPGASSEVQFDLAKQQDLTVVWRKPFFLGPNDTPYETVVLKAGQKGLKGKVKIVGAGLIKATKTGTGVDPQKNKWGVGLHIDYTGPVTIKGKPVWRVNIEAIVGTYAAAAPWPGK